MTTPTMPLSDNKPFTFHRVKETKNTVRYEEAATVPGIGTLYIQKFWLENAFKEFPDQIIVTVSGARQ